MTRGAKIAITVAGTLLASIIFPLALFALAFGQMCSSHAVVVPEILFFPCAAIVGGYADSHQPEIVLILLQFPVYGIVVGRAWVKENSFAALLVPCAHVLAILAATIVRKV
jgi:hypothetical protein